MRARCAQSATATSKRHDFAAGSYIVELRTTTVTVTFTIMLTQESCRAPL